MPQKRREWPRRNSVEAADDVGLGGTRVLLALLGIVARGGHCRRGVPSRTVAAGQGHCFRGTDPQSHGNPVAARSSVVWVQPPVLPSSMSRRLSRHWQSLTVSARRGTCRDAAGITTSAHHAETRRCRCHLEARCHPLLGIAAETRSQSHCPVSRVAASSLPSRKVGRQPST